jgi:hypothetical protein
MGFGESAARLHRHRTNRLVKKRETCMMQTTFGTAAGLLAACCVIPYLRDVAAGTTVPQRSSWLIYSTLATVSAISQMSAGASAGALLSAGSAVGFTAVFVVSIRHGVGGKSVHDVLAIAVAGIGLLLWYFTGDPLLALISVVVAEVAATALTVAKARNDPMSETLATWVMDGTAGLLSLAGVSELTPANVLYPIHHVLMNAAVAVAIVSSRGRPIAGLRIES